MIKLKANILIEKLKAIEQLIGNTPIMPLFGNSRGIYAKLEYTNFSGSIKDRATLSLLKKAIDTQLLKKGDFVIESTSGNFGISLAFFSAVLGFKFIPVIDPNITSINRKILEFLAYEIIEVTERDKTGGFLLNRLKAVEEFKSKNKNVYHPNQYENEFNYLGYQPLAEEISRQFETLDYIVVAVSTGGTITGLSMKIRDYFPNIKIVAVDVKGSLIFKDTPLKRNLPGIGSSIRSKFVVDCAEIDEILIFDETEIVEKCRQMAKKEMIFAGVSSGATYAGAKVILERHKNEDVNILMICPDRGTSYIDSVFNMAWSIK